MKEKKQFEINIVQLPDPILHKKSHNVPIPLTDEDIKLAESMIYHIDDSQSPDTKFRPGVGVAAVQYGILKNVFYVHVKDGEEKTVFKDVLFNPKALVKSDKKIAIESGEGCLSVDESIPNQDGLVHRSNKVVVEAYSYFERKQLRYEVSGYLAIVFQHELDHLNGMLFIDRIDKKQPHKKKNKAIYI
ncbi:peptide deformylase [Mycoplasma sp. 394]